MSIREYHVQGMTCEHCAAAVREEVAAAAGVQVVEVDLASGRLSVVGAAIADEAVSSAVQSAGYRIAA